MSGYEVVGIRGQCSASFNLHFRVLEYLPVFSWFAEHKDQNRNIALEYNYTQNSDLMHNRALPQDISRYEIVYHVPRSTMET